ncbi:MAG: RluA family pseudouridine synthase [Phycisphaerales bacterium]|nr:RluA family pseudouridine synthase [Phycisphaerales bacterium]
MTRRGTGKKGGERQAESEVEIDPAEFGYAPLPESTESALSTDEVERGAEGSEEGGGGEVAAAPVRLDPAALLHVDRSLVVVNKPSGVLAAPGRGGHAQLSELVRSAAGWGTHEPLRLVHRLDRGASGVMLYARTLEAQRALVADFAERRIEKVYHALVSGFVVEDGEVKLALKFDKRQNRMTVARSGGKPAHTLYRILERVAGNTLLECRPVTGRTHQIRVHMAAIGHPLTVDTMYGGGQTVLLSHYKADYRPSGRHPERPLIARLTLHARRIEFKHPDSGETVAFEAPLPRDLAAAVRQLGRVRSVEKRAR